MNDSPRGVPMPDPRVSQGGEGEAPRLGQSDGRLDPSSQETVPVYLTPGEIWSLLMQYKDRDLGTADQKLADAYKAATGEDCRYA